MFEAGEPGEGVDIQVRLFIFYFLFLFTLCGGDFFFALAEMQALPAVVRRLPVATRVTTGNRYQPLPTVTNRYRCCPRWWGCCRLPRM